MIEPADNEFLFLYDVSNYSKAFTITDDCSQVTHSEFLIKGEVPFGIVELTGNVRIRTFDNEPVTFMFYRAIPGKKKIDKTL